MTSSKQRFSKSFLYVITALLLLVSAPVSAQTETPASAAAPAIMPLQLAALDEQTLSSANTVQESYRADYPGGAAQLATYLKANVKYPELARENNFEGTTIIRFKVLEDGTLDQFSVQQSTHDICDQAVITTLKKMTPWIPAQVRGKTVVSWRAVAVDFRMTF